MKQRTDVSCRRRVFRIPPVCVCTYPNICATKQEASRTSTGCRALHTALRDRQSMLHSLARSSRSLAAPKRVSRSSLEPA